MKSKLLTIVLMLLSCINYNEAYAQNVEHQPIP